MGCNTVVAYKRRQASCPVRLRHFRRRDEGDFLRSSQRPICGISYMEMGWFDLGGSVRPMPRHPFTEPTGSRWRLRGRGDCNGVCLTDDFRRNTVTNRGSATPLHQLRHRHQTVVEASLAQPAELRRYASGGRGSGCTCCHNASAVQCYVLLHLEYIFVVPVRVQPLCFSRVRV
jgi:hypothetical protein